MLVFKMAAVLVVLLVGLAGGFLSKRMEGAEGGETALSLGNALAGGIFLGAGLLHLLPDAAEGMGTLIPGLDFPLAFLLAAAGFALVLFIERVLFSAHEELEGMEEGAGPSIYPYVLALVLSVHSVFAGISLGLEATFLGSAAIFIAIIAHKGSAAFSLGVGLVRSFVPEGSFWRILFLFSCMTPLGIVLGGVFTTVLSGNAEAGSEAVFDGLAAGTFLYVAVLDVIDEEFHGGELKVTKFALFLGGVGLMAALALVL